MKKENILIVVVTLVVGLLVGVIVTKTTRGGSSGQGQAQGQGQAPVQNVANYQQNIQMLKDLTAKEPGNRNAWVQLGHNYFDSNQPMEAIQAYDKALELNPNDADVLTDQGVMFRQLGWFDRAVENFTKANEVNPDHAQSLYNLGIVYKYDLQDLGKARDAWTKLIQKNPNAPGADKIKAEIDAINSQLGSPAFK